MSNSDLLVLSDSSKSHIYSLNIFYPVNTNSSVSGTIYKTFTSDQFAGVSDSSSLPTSKNFDAPPSSLGNLLSVTLPDDIILSRQIIGWRVEISIISKNGITSVSNFMWKGRVNGFTKSGGYWNMELADEIIEINKQTSLILSVNCPRVFGKCGVLKTGFDIIPTAVNGFNLVITPISFTNDPNWRYDVIIGDSSYAVTGFVINAGLLQQIILDRKVPGMPEFARLSNTCDQSLSQCSKYNNTANFLGVVGLPSSNLSLSL